jgi:hypothetical protein
MEILMAILRLIDCAAMQCGALRGHRLRDNGRTDDKALDGRPLRPEQSRTRIDALA